MTVIVAEAVTVFDVLCTSCLRVRTVANPFNVTCDCGNTMCKCPYCQLTIDMLRNGERRGEFLGVALELVDWTEQYGFCLADVGVYSA